MVEAQSDEAEGDGSVAVAGDPEDLDVVVRAWEGMCARLRVCVQTPLLPLQALGRRGDRWQEEVDRGEGEDREDLEVGRPLVAEACKAREAAVDREVEDREGGAGHAVRAQENP